MSKTNYNEPFEVTCINMNQAAPNMPIKETPIKVAILWEHIIRIEEFHSPIVTSTNRSVVFLSYMVNSPNNPGLVIQMKYEDLLELWVDYRGQEKLGLFKNN